MNEFSDLGGGVLGYHGFNSSFRTTQGGLSLNIGMLAQVCIVIYVFQVMYINAGIADTTYKLLTRFVL